MTMKPVVVVAKPKDFRDRFKEDHPNTLISDKSFGVLEPGSLIQVENRGQWVDGIVDKILYAIAEKQVTFFVRTNSFRVSIPHREGEPFPDYLRPKE